MVYFLLVIQKSLGGATEVWLVLGIINFPAQSTGLYEIFRKSVSSLSISAAAGKKNWIRKHAPDVMDVSLHAYWHKGVIWGCRDSRNQWLIGTLPSHCYLWRRRTTSRRSTNDRRSNGNLRALNQLQVVTHTGALLFLTRGAASGKCGSKTWRRVSSWQRVYILKNKILV